MGRPRRMAAIAWRCCNGRPMIAIAQDGETLDALCWRVLGRTADVTEQALDLNRGLADLGAQLPGGTEVILPEMREAARVTRETVKLWD